MIYKMLPGLLLLTNLSVISAEDILKTHNDQEVSLNGTWRGTSVCEDRSSSCKDESVVYHLSHESGSRIVKVNADKIVDGKTIEMGALVFDYDPEKKTLTSSNGNNVWQLTIRGNQMLGTLVRDGSVFRKVALTRD